MARPTARFKSCPEHFEVAEQLAFVPSGEGAHQYLYVQKVGINTTDAAARIARCAGVPTRDIGFAGMKDKHAVTRQWFSVPDGAFVCGAIDAEVAVLETSRHTKKLRRGEVAANDFRVLLCAVGAAPAIPHRFANAFGPQRFGGDNLAQATDWVLHRRRRKISRFKQGLYLSVLRGTLFNAVLDARMRQDNWDTLLPGDVADAQGLPTGPLWGRGRSATAQAAADIEREALLPFADVMDALEHAGVNQDRRSFVAEARNLTVEACADDALALRFTLPAGAYATVFLAQGFDLVDVSQAA